MLIYLLILIPIILFSLCPPGPLTRLRKIDIIIICQVRESGKHKSEAESLKTLRLRNTISFAREFSASADVGESLVDSRRTGED
jgi:hypothetical protein